MSFIKSKGVRIASVAAAFAGVIGMGSVAYSAPAGCEDDLDNATVVVNDDGTASVSGLNPACWEDGLITSFSGAPAEAGATGAGGATVGAGSGAGDAAGGDGAGGGTYPFPGPSISRADRIELASAGVIPTYCASDSLSAGSALDCGLVYSDELGRGTLSDDGTVTLTVDSDGRIVLVGVLDGEEQLVQRSIIV